MKKLLLLPLIVLAGCANLQAVDFAKMSAEQISALAKLKDATIVCVNVPTPWGAGKSVYLSVDKGVIVEGGMSVDADRCSATFTSTKTPPPGSTTTTVTTVPRVP